MDSVSQDKLATLLREKGVIIPVDKPLGWTSFDVVNKIRVHLKYSFGLPKLKVGHAGTLDPLATGLLLVCVGKTTKRIVELQEGMKTYTGTIRLGEITPSLDGETAVCHTMPYQHVTSQATEEAVAQLSGEQWQIPPVFSAIKQDGKRAYKMARKQQEVDLPARKVHIHKFTITAKDAQNVEFLVQCSRGTYIRSLARDLGVKLNTCAYLTSLRRIASGGYDVETAYSMEKIDEPFRMLIAE